jgi:hypothetical protein
MFNDEQEVFLDQKEVFLDSYIDKDDEHLLFVSSYIHGHFSVVAANLSQMLQNDALQNEVRLIEAKNDLHAFAHLFEGLLCQDIEQAIANNELSESDANAVKAMLAEMFKA